MGSGGLWWAVVGCGGLWWALVDSRGPRWEGVGLWWAVVGSGGQWFSGVGLWWAVVLGRKAPVGSGGLWFRAVGLPLCPPVPPSTSLPSSPVPPPLPRARGAKISGRRGAGWPSGSVGWRGALRRVERRAALRGRGDPDAGGEVSGVGRVGSGHPGSVAGRPAGKGGVTRTDEGGPRSGPRAPGSEGPVGAAAAGTRSSPETAAARLPGRRRDGRRRRGPAARTPSQRCDQITHRRTLPQVAQDRDRDRRRGGGVRRRRRGP